MSSSIEGLMNKLKATATVSTELVKADNAIVVNLFNDWHQTESLKAQTELSFDIETTGESKGEKSFNSYPEKHRIRLIQVYLPTLDQVAILDLWNLTTEQTAWLSQLLIQLADPTVAIFIQNAMFDAYWILFKFRVVIRNIIDTRLLSQLSKAGQYEAYKFEAGIDNPNSLGYLSLEHDMTHDKGEQSSDWSQLKLTLSQLAYAARDTIACYRIGKRLHRQLTLSQPLTVIAELGSVPAFVQLQYAGIPSDPSVLFQMYSQYHQAATREKARLESLMPYDPVQHQKVLIDRENPKIGKRGQLLKQAEDKPFNVASSKQVIQYLQILGFDSELKKLDKKTGEDRDSSGRDILFSLYSENKKVGSQDLNQRILELFQKEGFNGSDLDVIDSILAIIYYRGIAKAASTLGSYLDGYDPYLKRIPTAYSVLATQGMGRSSSGDRSRSDVQNCQNVSKHLPSHQAFGLPPIRSVCRPRDGWVFAEFDLAASHAQFARYLSGDRALQESYDSGVKLHYYTLSGLLKFDGMTVTPEECIDLVAGKADITRLEYYKQLYKLAKIVFYSFLNYSGGQTLQDSFFKYEQFVRLIECKKYLEACAVTFSGLRSFQDEIYRKAMNDRVLLHTEDGTYRSLGWFVRTRPIDGSTVYHRVNTENGRFHVKISDVVSVQWMRPEGTAIKTALGQVSDRILDDWGTARCRLVNFSHDSYMLEIRKDSVETIAPICAEILDRNMQVFVPDYVAEDPWQKCIKIGSWEK